MPATSSQTTGTVVTSAITVTAEDSSTMPLQACNTADCKVNKYVEVTKRKCSQFVTTPFIMQKPLVVNGKTSIFQVGGDMAKMGDIPALSSATGGNGEGQPIYRIKPGTHAHVVNYVFVDEDSDSLDKAKLDDQEAMRILLETHREIAASKLQKLISMHRGHGTQLPSAANSSAAANPTSSAANTVRQTTPQTHPNLSIANVVGASSATTESITITSSSAPSTVSLTHTTPAVATRPAAASAPAVVPAPASTPLWEKTIEQLQAEILSLRRQMGRPK